MREKVLIIGHSFIGRLKCILGRSEDIKQNFGLDLEQCVVKLCGLSGGTLDRFQRDANVYSVIQSFRPRVIIAQIGGNDICSVRMKPEVFACDLIEWLEALLKQFTFLDSVFICEVFIRTRPRHIDAQTYETRRIIINQMLKDMCEVHSSIMYWKHLRLMHSPLQIISDDGVHLSRIGNKKFYRSLRLAIMHAVRHLAKD